MDRFLRKRLQLLKYVALIIAGSLYIWSLIFLLKSDNWLGISALTTMLLALAAFWTIWNSNEQEKHRREKELSKERRDRDTAWLNDIIDWAVEVVKIGTPAQSLVIVGSIDKEADRRLVLNTLISLKNDFRSLIAVSLYVSRIGLAFGEKLKSSIYTLDENLRKQDDIIAKLLKIVVEGNTRKFDEVWDELIDHWSKLGESAAGVIDKAIIEKLNILNI